MIQNIKLLKKLGRDYAGREYFRRQIGEFVLIIKDIKDLLFIILVMPDEMFASKL